MDEKSLTKNDLENLATEVGEFIRYWGFKQIHGRIWTYLFVASAPLDAATLIERLKVSKALMSLSLNDLLKYNVIKEAGRSDRGTNTYVANPNILEIIMGILENREKAMLDRIAQAHHDFETRSHLSSLEINASRLRLLGDFIRQAQITLDQFMAMSDQFRGWLALNKAVGSETDTDLVQ